MVASSKQILDQLSGQGPHENQTSPHVHFTDLTPDQYLVTRDLGTDEVTTHDVSQKLCKLYTYAAKLVLSPHRFPPPL